MISDLYSKRRKREKGELSDVYQYDTIPIEFRRQVMFILQDATGVFNSRSKGEEIFDAIIKILCREYGIPTLLSSEAQYYSNSFYVIQEYLCVQKDSAVEQILDVIDLAFNIVNNYVRESPHDFSPEQDVDSAIDELNFRFREHEIGYQFEQGQVIRIDEELIHAEVVRPLLTALKEDPFIGALREFQSAHEHYRHGNHESCLVECGKAFESVMKAICTGRSWPFQPGDTASKLLKVLFANNYFPSYLQTQFTSFRAVLESGVPTMRNQSGAHGQGAQVRTVPQEMAEYCLHLTATNLLFLVKQYK